jgi:hypothetical protein
MVRRPHNQSPDAAPVIRKQDRRNVPDRRKVTHKGRRGSDPEPRCASCGLLVPDKPHGRETDCIAALRAVLERLISEAPIEVKNPFE